MTSDYTGDRKTTWEKEVFQRLHSKKERKKEDRKERREKEGGRKKRGKKEKHEGRAEYFSFGRKTLLDCIFF